VTSSSFGGSWAAPTCSPPVCRASSVLDESLAVSPTAFHRRGFGATAFEAGDPQSAMATIDAGFALLIEITFIATFTQRFFAR
jgi:hypothetical protein